MPPLIDRLSGLVPGASRRTLRQMIEHGRVLVNGVPARRGDLDVSEAAAVVVLPKGATLPGAAGIPLPIIHEDKALIVIDKPPGLVTAAPRSSGKESAWSRVRRIFRERRSGEEPFLVHRLDEAASGAILFAKSEKVQTRLKEIFAAHDVDRIYAALVKGRPRRDEGEFRSHLVEMADRMHHVRSVRPADDEETRAGSREAITRWRVREGSEGSGDGGALSAVEIRLETGRKHQIRVQFSEAGHPVLGDRLYGGPKAERLFLHAWVLGLAHPATGEPLRVVSTPPPAFEERVPGAFRKPSPLKPR
jgi:23S rRNA pseudouridine1911/1915/1917 synthase